MAAENFENAKAGAKGSKAGMFLYGTWYGSAVCIALLIALFATFAFGAELLKYSTPAWMKILANVCFFLLPVAFLNGLAAVVVSLARKCWTRAIVQFLVWIGLGAILVFCLLFYLFFGLFGGESEDHFGDNLAIPADLEVEEPLGGGYFFSDITAEKCRDDFSLALMRALDSSNAVEKTLAVSLGSLERLAGTRRDFLLEYLAAHPGWWVHEDGGRLCATRRWKVDGRWMHNLHGYYCGRGFQTRATIGFPDFVFGRPRGVEVLPMESVAEVKPRPEKYGVGKMTGSLFLKGEGVSLDIFDQDDTGDFRMMRASVAILEDEFKRLEQARTREEMRALLPADAVLEGDESFVLRDGMQGGIYNLTLRLNPGEAGTVYLKAFEATKGTPLSVERLEKRSGERVGWSENPEEKFLSEVDFTIYEGDWGKFYAARFEVWFRPDGGGAERKLMERVFKIQGWMR